MAQELGERPVQLRGSRVARAALRLAGWRLHFDGLPAAQGVVVVYPHTSNWDFPVALLAKWAVGLPVTFWGKDTLFRVPLFGRWLRWLGGLPVARHTPQGAVGQMVDAMRAAREQGRFMWLALAPEGTRGRTEGWRSGFYRVAVEAGVPVGLVTLDFAHRRIGFDSFWRLSGRMSDDFAVFAHRLAGCRGCRPLLAAPVRPLGS
jgi:1-acyl-sn-glycerol-3-phosphate acyltransferase